MEMIKTQMWYLWGEGGEATGEGDGRKTGGLVHSNGIKLSRSHHHLRWAWPERCSTWALHNYKRSFILIFYLTNAGVEVYRCGRVMPALTTIQLIQVACTCTYK